MIGYIPAMLIYTKAVAVMPGARSIMTAGVIALSALFAGCGSDKEEHWKFVVIGDTRGNSPTSQVNTAVLADIVQSAADHDPDLVLVTGDLVDYGTEAAFREWKNVAMPLYQAGIAVYPVRGNHDSYGGATAWGNVFGPDVPDNGPTGETDLTYSVLHKNALFVCLDEYASAHRVNQSWLDTQLADGTAQHTFVVGHEPAFAVAHKECLDDYPAERDRFWQSMEDKGVGAYFCGHDHLCDRARIDNGDGEPGNDVWQYIAGAGGAPLTPFPWGYNGDNGTRTPVSGYHNGAEFGYLVVEVDGNRVTMTWYARKSAGNFAAADVIGYSKQ